ncbi:hypothetical protein D018_3354B, partial [Vibrio parahaemolyticus VP2007-007]
AKNIG